MRATTKLCLAASVALAALVLTSVFGTGARGATASVAGAAEAGRSAPVHPPATAAVFGDAVYERLIAPLATAVSAPAISAGPDLVLEESDDHVDIPVTLSAPGTSTVTVFYSTANAGAFAGTACNADYTPASGTLDVPARRDDQVGTRLPPRLPRRREARGVHFQPVEPNRRRHDRPRRSADPNRGQRHGCRRAEDHRAGRHRRREIGLRLRPDPARRPRRQGVRRRRHSRLSDLRRNGDCRLGLHRQERLDHVRPGEVVKNVVVPITDDGDAEPAEAFKVKVTGFSGATMGRDTGIVTIGASDGLATGAPAVSAGPDAVVSEGDGWIDLSVTLSAPGTGPVSVFYNTANAGAFDGTACNADYVGDSGHPHLPPRRDDQGRADPDPRLPRPRRHRGVHAEPRQPDRGRDDQACGHTSLDRRQRHRRRHA